MKYHVWVCISFLNTVEIFIFFIRNLGRLYGLESCNWNQCFDHIFLVLYIHLGCFYSSVWFRSSPEDLVFGFHRIYQLISSQIWVATCNWNNSSHLSRSLSLSVYIFSGMYSCFSILPLYQLKILPLKRSIYFIYFYRQTTSVLSTWTPPKNTFKITSLFLTVFLGWILRTRIISNSYNCLLSLSSTSHHCFSGFCP